MEPTPAKLLKVRLAAYAKALPQNPLSASKDDLISKHLADDFNGIVVEIGELFPAVKNSLPKPITARGPFARMGLADIGFQDLRVLVEQALGIVDLLESGS